MSGFWQNIGNPSTPNLGLLINQAIQGGNRSHLPQQGLVSYGNDIHTARALLAASLPSSQPTFRQTQAPPLKTTSVISLPPSLANRRKRKADEIASSLGQVEKTFEGLQESSQGSMGDQCNSNLMSENPFALHNVNGEKSASKVTYAANISSDGNSASSVTYAVNNSPVGNSASNVTYAVNKSRGGNSKSKNPYVVNNMTAGNPSINFVGNPSVGISVASKLPASEAGPGIPGCESTESNNPVYSTEISKGIHTMSNADDTQSIVLDPFQPKLLKYTSQRLLHDNEFWHKFVIIGGAKFQREKVLKEILQAVEPSLLLPVMYQEENEDTTFFARNCGSAAEKLYRIHHLSLQLDGTQFFMRIILQSAPVHKLRVNALSLLRRVMDKRWNKDRQILDLSDFEHDPELDNFMFCPLSQPSVLQYVLHTAINQPINFSILILAHNHIRQLNVDILNKASYLRSIDLSNNELLYQKDLNGLKDLNSVTSLVLDGNPLCSEFNTPEAYVSSLKSIMPQLKSLDRVSLFSGPISVVKEQNFLCSKTGYSLVDQYLKHFFNRYDWSDRRCLDGLYHENALFSLTCLYVPGQNISNANKLTWYTSYNRNLMKLSDYSKADKLVFHGPSEILDLFCSLPATEHDPYSFCVDLIHFNDKAAVISVSGVFRENPTMPPDPDYMRAFRRVFVLSCVSTNEWQITNEQLHITNPTSRQCEASFKVKRPPLEAPVAAWLVQDAQLLSEDEKDQMSNIMVQLTTLNKQWATRFLVESHWYVREALIAFVNQYEAKTLPEEAFASEKH